jgi:primosomal replication protein N
VNSAVLAGTIVWRDVLRETPAGIAILNLRIHHRSSQQEGGRDVPVEVELTAMAVGEVARQMNGVRLNDAVSVRGFLQRKAQRDPEPVLHINQFKLS